MVLAPSKVMDCTAVPSTPTRQLSGSMVPYRPSMPMLPERPSSHWILPDSPSV